MMEEETRKYEIEITESYIPVLQDIVKMQGYNSLADAMRDAFIDKFKKSIMRRPQRGKFARKIPDEDLRVRIFEMNVPTWKKNGSRED